NKDGAAALSALNGASPYEAVAGPWLFYLRGLADTLTGDYRQAVEHYRALLAHPGYQPTSVVHTIAQLQMARAERDAGNTADARKAYADFANVMRAARPGHPLLAESTREAGALPAAAASPTR